MSGSENADGVDSTGAFATMVIRVWLENRPDDRFRARLTFAGDSGGVGSTTMTNAPSDVLDAVRDWLAAVQADAATPDGAGH
ncbi:hypothetical protein [Mycetocola miduiensis]|uniref:Uncharacterized protein n=1 Tax=Mycetocola miduiensis TaxID=995034 RepID=A0A1I5BMW2_9MICO|nr:hypothetical protein [Mycetocola miduiensis]SFN76002.1 hypothetical protein SAMN05216219_1985 [Mycetocola miduiensis]